MKHNITILTFEEIIPLTNLFVTVWGGDYDIVYAKNCWAFQNTHSHVIIAKNGSDIIAARGAIKWPINLEGTKYNFFQFHGTCVHPAYRRIGLFTELNKLFIKHAIDINISGIFNISVKASKLGYQKLGWVYLKGLHRLTYASNVVKCFTNYKDLRKEPLVVNDMESINFNNSFDTSLLDARKQQFRTFIHTDYTIDFLRWRLSNNREGYKVIATSRGTIVYKKRRKGHLLEVIIGEIFLYKNSYSDFCYILRFILKKEKPDIIFTYITRSHPYYSLYKRFLFFPNIMNYNLNLGTKILDTKIKELFEKNYWAISFLDIDTF